MWGRMLLSLPLVAMSAPVFAGSIFGQVTSTGSGAGIAGVEVRAYAVSMKGWRVAATTLTDGNGNYSFSQPAGDYLVQAAPGDTTTQCLHTQRYFDVAAPFAGGNLQEAADVVTLVSAGSTITGINIAMAASAGFDGRVMQGGMGIDGMRVRVEQTGDPRIHVDTMTSSIGGVAGSFSACGITPGAYRFWIHDFASQYEDLVVAGPFTAIGGNRQTLGAFTATLIGNDPYEPNPSTSQATPVAPLTTPWTSIGAIIAPVASDVDVYCLDALAGDRYVITTSTTVLVAGMDRSSPWVDPVLGWFSATPELQLAVNDDDATLPGSLNARIETDAVAEDGRYCVVVSTFDDQDFNASGQASAGRYAVRIARVGPMFADGFE